MPNAFDQFDAKAPDNPFDRFDAPTQATPAPAPIARPSGLVRRVVGDTAVDLGKGIIGVGEAAVGAADLVTGGHAGKALESVGYDPATSKKMLEEGYSPERVAANQQVQDAKGFVGTAKAMIANPSTILGTAVESAPLMLGGGAIARGAGAALSRVGSIARPGLAGAVSAIPHTLAGQVALGAAGEGIVGAASAAEQTRQQSEDRLLSAEQVGASLGSGVGTAALGAVGGGLARKLGIADVDVALAGGSTLGTAKKNILRRVAEGALSEGVFEELPQSAQEQMWQNYATGKPLMDGVAEASAAGALAGGVMGGGFSAIARPGAEQPKPKDTTETPSGVGAPLSGAINTVADPTAVAQPATPDPLNGDTINAELDAQRTENGTPADAWKAAPIEQRQAFMQQAGFTNRAGELSEMGANLSGQRFENLPPATRKRFAESLAPQEQPKPTPSEQTAANMRMQAQVMAANAKTGLGTAAAMVPAIQADAIEQESGLDRLTRIAQANGLDPQAVLAVNEGYDPTGETFADLPDEVLASYAKTLLEDARGPRQDAAGPVQERPGVDSVGVRGDAVPVPSGELDPAGSVAGQADAGTAIAGEQAAAGADDVGGAQAEGVAGNVSLGSISDIPFQQIGDLGVAGELTAGMVSPADWNGLRAAGLVQNATSEDGSPYEYVPAAALWDERERRSNEARSRARASVTSPEEQQQARERRASNYDRMAQEQEDLGELGDLDKAAELRGMAARVRAGLPAREKSPATAAQAPQDASPVSAEGQSAAASDQATPAGVDAPTPTPTSPAFPAESAQTQAVSSPSPDSAPVAAVGQDDVASTIRTAFKSATATGYSIGNSVPVSVTVNGKSRNFIARQKSLSNGKKAAPIELRTVEFKRLVSGNPPEWVTNTYKLDGNGDLKEVGLARPATDYERKFGESKPAAPAPQAQAAEQPKKPRSAMTNKELREAEKAKKQARRKSQKVGPARKPRDLLDVIARSGGLNREAFRAQGVDPAEFNRQSGIRYVFRKNGGMSLSDLRELMQQEGYLPRDPEDGQPVVDDNDALDLFDRALRGGGAIYADDQWQDVAEYEEAKRQADAEYEAEMRASPAFGDGFDSVMAQADNAAYVKSYAELTEEAYDLGATAEDIIEASFRADPTAYLQTVIERLSNENDAQSRAEEGRGASRAEPREEAQSRARSEGTGQAQEVKPASAGLFGAPSSRDILDNAQRNKDAKRDGKTGTGRTDMLAGDGDLFAGPAPAQAEIPAPSQQQANPKSEKSEPKPPAQAASEPGTKIDDFGETLHGARKHYAQGYADRMKDAENLDVASNPLSKTWPEPDYDKLLEGGADPAVVAWVHAARDEIPQKPVKSWKQKGWAESVKLLREVSARLLDGSIGADRLQEVMEADGHERIAARVGGRAALYQEVGHGVDLKGVTLEKHTYALYRGEKNVTKWSVEKPAKATAFSNWPQELGVGDTREEAIAAFKTNLDKVTPQAKDKQPLKFVIYSYRGKPGFVIGKKVGKQHLDVQTFDTVKEAREYLSNNQEALEAKFKKLTDIPFERRETNEPRVGVDHRSGADVAPDQFSETFGFRGVQFGNYVEGKRRQQDLNNAYDALLDMAGVLGIPPRSLSLNGTLGLAFGARGKGGKNPAAAHYEPDTVVINLTKGNGAGSLAHEWWHGLDNYFAMKREAASKRPRADQYLTEIHQSAASGVRPEMVKAFNDVANVVERTGIKERSKNLDKRRTKAYWSTGREMTARSFESYIIARLADQNAANDYLANIVSEESFGIEGGYPYPTVGELAQVRAAYDAFFDTIESRETDTGIALEDVEELSDADLTPAEKASRDRQSIDKKGLQGELNRQQGQRDAEASGLADGVQSLLGGADIKIVYARDVKGLAGLVPEGFIGQRMDLQASRAGTKLVTAGLYVPGTISNDKKPFVVIYTGNGLPVSMQIFAAAHEIAGHDGLRKMLGPRLRPVLDLVAQNPTVRKVADSMFRTRKYAERIADPQDAMTAEQAHYEVIEEALADLAAAVRTGNWQRITDKHGVAVPKVMQSRVRAMLDNLVQRIKELFRRKDVRFSDGQVRQLLENAWKAAQGNSASMSIVGPNGALEQVVFHGTPHTVDKFSLQKIGTGEGAQAYGWGLYFASLREVADGYRVALTADQNRRQFAVAAAMASSKWFKPGLVVNGKKYYDRMELQGDIDRRDLTSFDMPADVAKVFTEKLAEPSGNLYRVDVPEDSDLLDWDKPLSEQPEKVQTFANLYFRKRIQQKPLGGGLFDVLLDGASIGAFAEGKLPAVALNLSKHVGLKGRALYEMLAREQGGAQAASEALNAAGIPGLRYLDGNSRTKGEGSANYVIWDEAAIGTPSSALESTEDQTQSEAFKRWFGDSKITSDWEGGATEGDGAATPRVLYHATTGNFDTFELGPDVTSPFAGTSGPVIFMSADADEQHAGHNVGRGGMFKEGANVMPLYARIENPLLIDDRNLDKVVRELGLGRGFPFLFTREMVGKIEAAGYDGIVHFRDDAPNEVIAFHPEQVKSATGNSGNFNPDNPSILESVEAVGDALAGAMNSVRDVKLPAGYLLADLFGKQEGAKSLSWWSATIGTQYDLAQRSPLFKRVFDSVQNMVADVSHYANAAMNLAPDILPKFDSMWDAIKKKPMSAADAKKVSDAVFQGTKDYMRVNGEAVKTSDVSKAGIVWTPEELRSVFGMTGKLQPNGKYDGQIGLYEQSRAAIDRSLDDTAVSQMIRHAGEDGNPVREQMLAAGNAQVAADILEKHLVDQVKLMQGDARSNGLLETAEQVQEIAKQIDKLKSKGYAPLSRFGRYTVYRDGDNPLFLMFETQREANRAARMLREKDGGKGIKTGVMSQEQFKLFKGMTPETLELFGEMLGLDKTGNEQDDAVFQTFLKAAKSNRSALKRLIHRQGIEGYSQDLPRVLAAFLYSNARMAATNLHAPETQRAINEIPKEQGDLQDAAIKLNEYIVNPDDAGAFLSGFNFAQYLGGSIASAMVNMTQPLTMSFPWLSQYGGAWKAAKALGEAAKLVGKGGNTGNDRLDEALKRADADGHTQPQEVHQLQAYASGNGILRTGDGTKAGDAIAKAFNAKARVVLAWGIPFSLAEQFNRRTTFIAAFNMATEQGMTDPYGFAVSAVQTTQGIYNKANKPTWARNAIGGMAFTFKTYSINYVEMLHRMWTQGGKEGKQGVLLAAATMFLLAGAGGLPGADDLDDIIDGLMQRLGYNFSSKQEREEFFASLIGEDGAAFMEHGLSAVPGMPVDVSGRLGMGNLIPSTGLFVRKADHSRDIAEIAGPTGDFIKRSGEAAGLLAEGEVFKSMLTIAPRAVANAWKGVEMGSTGEYRDTRGRNVLDTTTGEAIAKGIGFQPASVAKVQQASGKALDLLGNYRIVSASIADRWAKGIHDNDPEQVQDAKEALAEWNRKNPDMPIRIGRSALRSRVRNLGMDRRERLSRATPKAVRSQVEEILDTPRRRRETDTED